VNGEENMTKKIAVGYPRVSGAGQGEKGYSLEDQVKQIEAFCHNNGIELRAHFREVESAKTVAERPTFKAALRHLYESGADYLIVTNLDRFSRSVFDAEALRRSMERRGKKLIAVQQRYLTPLNDDPDEEDELIAARQKASIEAELERKKIRRRCLSGKRQKAAIGGWTGHAPWYEVDVIRGRPVPNKERMRVVRLILRLRRVGAATPQPMSFQKIADFLNGKNNLANLDGTRGRVFLSPREAREPIRQRRIPRRHVRSKWTMETVRRIFQNYESRVIKIDSYSEFSA
jgi:DNA invertase Pin-like site-specific DNA recombinase